ncbi:MAG: CPBP family intramembrane metalloprotease [Clostridia bacterium]|nr:CPBP family intramembrane metalloprotease [Clostridia bacterium]
MKVLERNRALFGVIVFIILLLAQILLGKAGHLVAGLIPYQSIDPFDCFAEVSIHHVVELLIALALILVLSKLLNLDFYFRLGDKKKGIKYLCIFVAAFVVLSVALHTFMTLNNQLPVYAFPLDRRNVIGTLGFQLLLSGPAEEVIYRALPITLLTYSFGKSIKIKGSVTLEVILSSILFAFAHVKWSLIPLAFEADYFQLIYAFAIGTIQGMVYQKTKSILYPILMHSLSNVLMVGAGYVFTVLFS